MLKDEVPTLSMASPLRMLTSPPWSPRTKRLVALISLGAVVFLVFRLGSAWFPVIIAVLLSYLLIPLVNRIEQLLPFIPLQGPRRAISVFLTFALVITVVTLSGLLIVPRISDQLQEFIDDSPEVFVETQADVEDFFSTPISIGGRSLVLSDAIENFFSPDNGDGTQASDISSVLQSAITALLVPAASLVGGLLNTLFSTLFTLVMMYYLMKDGTQFVDTIDRFVPKDYQGDFRLLLGELGKIWNAYFRGQLLLSLSVGIMTFVGASVLGLPQPTVLGLLAGLLEFIPNLGPSLSAIPAVLFALVSESQTIPGLQGVVFALIVVGMYVVLQNLEAVFLVPRILGGNLNLHPFVVLVAIIFGARIMGILGIILAAPVTATLRLIAMYIWSKLFDFDLFSTVGQPATSVISPGPALVPAKQPALASPLRGGNPDISEGEIIEE